MTEQLVSKGFAIAIAWPETYCRQPGSWYDGLSSLLGLSKYRYYKVGHAALVLIDAESSKCLYFDFGRYHAPYQYGRIRSEITDHGLQIHTRASISKDGSNIENLEEILTELQWNEECHGEGKLVASYCEVDFDMSQYKVIVMQKTCPLKYGPFVLRGTNCSRFVRSAIMAGMTNGWQKFKLRWFNPLTPTPMSNVKALNYTIKIPKLRADPSFLPKAINNEILKRTLDAPVAKSSIPRGSQWLSGEGCGSWFCIKWLQNEYQISRYSPDGEMECEGIFRCNQSVSFDINEKYDFDHLSHCHMVSIRQNGTVFLFERIN